MEEVLRSGRGQLTPSYVGELTSVGCVCWTVMVSMLVRWQLEGETERGGVMEQAEAL